MGAPGAKAAQHHQHRAKIGAVGQIDLGGVQLAFFKAHTVAIALKFCPAPLQNIQNSRITLAGVRAQAVDGNAALQRAQHGKKGRLTVIALHRVIPVVIALPAGDQQCVGFFAAPVCLHAEIVQHPQGKLHIAAAFKRRQNFDLAGLIQQRQRKQKAADKLAAHIARQLVLAAPQCALDGDILTGLGELQALAFKNFLIHAHGPLKQAACTRKAHLLAGKAEYRDEKAQGAAAFIAKHRLYQRGKAAMALNAGAVFAAFHLGAALPDPRKRGLDVLAEFQIFHKAQPLGKPGAQHGAVRNAFAGGCGDHGILCAQCARTNGYLHTHASCSVISNHRSMASMASITASIKDVS